MIDPSIVFYKRKYNKLLERHKKAEAYLENENIEYEKRKKWLPEYERILSQLNYLLWRIGDYKKEEILGGFKL